MSLSHRWPLVTLLAGGLALLLAVTLAGRTTMSCAVLQSSGPVFAHLEHAVTRLDARGVWEQSWRLWARDCTGYNPPLVITGAALVLHSISITLVFD